MLNSTYIVHGQDLKGIKNLAISTEDKEQAEITIDSVGNIWIIDKDKAIRHNSVDAFSYSRFGGFVSNPGTITTIFTDARGGLWIGAENGLFFYEAAKDHFQRIAQTTGSGLKNVTAITEDKAGHLLLAAGDGIWKLAAVEGEMKWKKISSETLHIHQLLSDNEQLLIAAEEGFYSLKPAAELKEISLQGSNPAVLSILLHNNSVLLGTREGLFSLKDDFSTSRRIYALPYEASSLPVPALALGQDENIYVATKGAGIFSLNKSLELEEKYEEKSGSISGSHIKDIFIDPHNVLWAVTAAGEVNALDLNSNIFKKLRHDPQKYSSIADDYTNAITLDSTGKVWFGTREGLSIWDPATGRWQHIKSLSFSHPSNTPDIIKDLVAEGDYVWVATYNDGLYKVNINTLKRAHFSPNTADAIGSEKLEALAVDAQEDIWAGGEGKLTELKKNGQINILPLEGVKVLAAGGKGNLIAAGRNKVYRIDEESHKISEIEQLRADAGQLPYFSINAIVEVEGKLLFGTYGAGLVVYDALADSLRIMDRKTGMPSDYIQGIVAGNQGEVWISTTNGLAEYNFSQNGEIQVFDQDKGLENTKFNARSFAKLGNGQMAFGAMDGVLVFNPKHLSGIKSVVPNLVFRKFEVKNAKKELRKKLGALEKVELEFNQSSFAISFLGISQAHPEDIRYSWKLAGLEEEWSAPSTQNTVNYAALSPGDYLFQVRTATANGPWSEVKTLAISIAAPWWQRPWLYALAAVLLFVVLLLAIFGQRRKNKKYKEQLELRFRENVNRQVKKPFVEVLDSFAKLSEQQDATRRKKMYELIARLKSILMPYLEENFKAVPVQKELQITAIVLEEFLAKVQKDFQPVLEQNQLVLVINDQWEQKVFYYDAGILDTIFFNILSSCIDHSLPQGKIIVNFFETSRGDLKIQIADNGRGIPQQEYHWLKEYYGNKSRNASAAFYAEESLMAVKDLLDFAGGKISVESREKEGTTFSLILKNHQPENPDIETKKVADDVPASLPDTKTKEVKVPVSAEVHVLVAEDNIEIRRILAEELEKYYQVSQSGTGREAMEMIYHTRPEILLVNSILPDMSAITLNAALQRDAELKKIAVFLMAEEKNIPAPVPAGILDIVTKPVSIHQLQEKIAVYLTTRRKEALGNSLAARNSNLFRSQKEEKFIDKAERIVLENLGDKDFSPEDLQEILGLTRNSLLLKMQQFDGRNPQEFIMKTKLEYARKLIADGESDLAAIARKSGFASKELFYTSFKKSYGYMPGSIFDRGL
ncbi:triple tyrosine motif-containing protein [Zunongwangia sp. H14]|uniref:triple tyrosine motif-containing protein n=1 Tax=Zunongwangia sp. H14 TaxID=3240792 RepID=UPI003568462C